MPENVGYKLTNPNGQTRDGMQWGPGVRHYATGVGKDLCSDGWIHYYDDPLLAVFFDCLHGHFGPDALLWRGIPDGKTLTDGTKSGAKGFTTQKTIPLPVITPEQRAEIAIRCALLVYQEPSFIAWATAWLDGTRRAEAAAWAEMAAWEVWVGAETGINREQMLQIIHQGAEGELT